MFNKDEIIELNGKDYLITNKLIHNDKTYYYISEANSSNMALVCETIKDNESYLESLSDPKEIELILALMLKDELK